MSQLMAMRKSIQGVFKKRGDGVGVSAQSRGEEVLITKIYALTGRLFEESS